MTQPLTLRQREVYGIITQRIRWNGIAPSVREIGRAMGLRSPSSVHQHLLALERKGWIRRGGQGIVVSGSG